MSDFFVENNIWSESKVSIVLNTFMYIDECNADNNEKTLGAIVARMEMNDGRQGFQNAALQILKDFLAKPENADIANLKLITYTENLGDQYTGAYAAAFQSADGSEVYVVYRGTGEGRWYDNGDGLANVSSPYQDIALQYFNDTIASLNVDDSTKIVVTGHSKGGNLAQYVTLTSEYNNLCPVKSMICTSLLTQYENCLCRRDFSHLIIAA